jgi:hypothetical protein
MKQLFTILFAALFASAAFAAEPFYSLQTVSLGTNAIPANTNLALPLTLATTIQTNPGVQAVFYLATNSATNTIKFTVPTTNTLSFTNTFIESNSVVGLGTKMWSVAETVRFTNNVNYYVTNGQSFTYSNGVVVATNAQTITTNKQVLVTSALVPFTITGTDYSTVTNISYGASALDVSKSAKAAVKVSFKLTGSGTSPVTFNYTTTADGSLDNAAGSSFAIAANGTTTVSTNIDLTVNSLGYLNLTSITNANATAVTNLVLKYGQKIAAP